MLHFNLEQFVEAQRPVYERVLRELRAGRKQSYWMWFIFPQMFGLGSSLMARQFGIPTLAAARDYLAHPLLGKRLQECTRILIRTESRSALAIFGSPDDLKFHASMTLFDRAHPSSCFREVLDIYFHGRSEIHTVDMLNYQRIAAHQG